MLRAMSLHLVAPRGLARVRMIEVRALSWLVLACASIAAPASAQDDGVDDVLHAPPPEPEAAPAPKKPAKRLAAPSPPAPALAPETPSPPAKPAPAKAESPASSPAATSASADTPPTEDDFAGHGPPPAASPQDDFESDVQVNRRRERSQFSIRFDPLNWLLLGRLSIELEASVWDYLTVMLTPVFVTAQAPIAVNYAGLDDPLTQHSNGLGPLSGTSVGVGVWPWGEPFHGYVFRLELTNYGYRYETSDAKGVIDRVTFTERRLQLFVGSHSRFGPFTFAGGFGLGYELNQVDRCGLTTDADGAIVGRTNDCHGKQQIALDRNMQERADLNGPLHPVYFLARFSLGVVF
jgi:hypothetical protein